MCNCVPLFNHFSRTLEPVEFPHGQGACRVPGIERGVRFEHQDDRLRGKRAGPMFDASRNDDEIAFAHFRHAVAKIDGDASAQHEEGLVLALVRMPIELSAEFGDLDLAVVDIADDERMETCLTPPVDRLKNVDLGWGHRSSPSLPGPSPRSRSSAPRRRGRLRESRQGRSRG
jgi:hypothetical protein